MKFFKDARKKLLEKGDDRMLFIGRGPYCTGIGFKESTQRENLEGTKLDDETLSKILTPLLAAKLFPARSLSDCRDSYPKVFQALASVRSLLEEFGMAKIALDLSLSGIKIQGQISLKVEKALKQQK